MQKNLKSKFQKSVAVSCILAHWITDHVCHVSWEPEKNCNRRDWKKFNDVHTNRETDQFINIISATGCKLAAELKTRDVQNRFFLNFGSVSIWFLRKVCFSSELVWFGSNNALWFGHYSYLLLT